MPIAIPPVPTTPLVRRQRPAAATTSEPEPVQSQPPVATTSPTATTDEDAAETEELRAIEELRRRWQREGRWAEMSRLRDEMMRAARRQHMPKRNARVWAYAELAKLYPPLPPPEIPKLPPEDDQGGAGGSGVNHASDGGDASPAVDGTTDGETSPARARNTPDPLYTGTERSTLCQPSAPESSRLQGLGDVPADWPPLPANASLQAEIGWVQANRLYVVEERGQSTIVRLERAHEPAPSRAAIGWLETSIRSYAKFCDVAARCLTSASDEVEQVRRERMQIDDIRSLLDEMHQD